MLVVLQIFEQLLNASTNKYPISQVWHTMLEVQVVQPRWHAVHELLTVLVK